MPITKENLNIQNVDQATDDVLRSFVAKFSNNQSAMQADLLSRRGKISATGANDPVSQLKKLLQADEDDEENYTLDDLINDIRNRVRIEGEYAQIANFLKDEKLLAPYNDDPKIIVEFKRYLRNDLEKQAREILQKREVQTVDKSKQKTENAIMGALRDTEDRLAMQRNKIDTQSGSLANQAAQLRTAIESMLKEISNAAVVAQPEPELAAPRAKPNVALLAGIAGGGHNLKRAPLRKVESDSSLSSISSDNSMVSNASSITATSDSSNNSKKSQLEATLKKKLPTESSTKLNKSREQIKQEKTQAINKMLAEIDLLGSQSSYDSELPDNIVSQLKRLREIKQELETWLKDIRTKQAVLQELENSATTNESQIQRAKPKLQLNPGLLAGIQSAASREKTAAKTSNSDANIKEPSEIDPKSQLNMQLEEQTQTRRLKLEYNSDQEFKKLVDEHLIKVNSNFTAAIADLTSKKRLFGILSEHTKRVEAAENLARSIAEREARKKADALAKLKMQEQLELLNREGIDFVKASNESVFNEFSNKLSKTIADVAQQMASLSNVAKNLDHAISAKQKMLATKATTDIQKTYAEDATEQPKSPTKLIRKKSLVVSDAAVNVAMQSSNKLNLDTIKEYNQLMKDLLVYVDAVQFARNYLKINTTTADSLKLAELSKQLTLAQPFKGKSITDRNVKILVGMTATTMEIANKTEEANRSKGKPNVQFTRQNTSLIAKILMSISLFADKVQKLLFLRKEHPISQNVFDRIAHMKHKVFVEAQNLRPGNNEH